MRNTRFDTRSSEWIGDMTVWLRENAEDNSEQLDRLRRNLRLAREQELTARQIADRCSSAVFCLNVYTTQKELDFQIPSAQASGFFISADGLAVTNYHSIEGAIHAEAVLSTGETYPVESVIYYDTGMDLAVLRISRTSGEGKAASAFSALEMVGTEDLRAGDIVYALGNPLGMGLAVSSGIISATERDVDGYALPCIMNTADISKGSSGGALLNVCGQVIAVTSGAFTYGNSMYLAVPVAPVMEADLTGEGLTLAQVTAAEKKAWLSPLTGVTCGSDAFFPFGDNVERAFKSGVKYIAEPGGSIRDDNVIEACNHHGITMCFTGIRLFHH